MVKGHGANPHASAVVQLQGPSAHDGAQVLAAEAGLEAKPYPPFPNLNLLAVDEMQGVEAETAADLLLAARVDAAVGRLGVALWGGVGKLVQGRQQSPFHTRSMAVA